MPMWTRVQTHSSFFLFPLNADGGMMHHDLNIKKGYFEVLEPGTQVCFPLAEATLSVTGSAKILPGSMITPLVL